jgi:RNA polymerase sigma-70 factor (ECF subfamily)
VIGEIDLVRAAHAGDAGSLGLLFERYRPRLLARAYGILGHGPEVEDAVHDTFLIALRRIDSLEDPAALPGWLDVVVRNVCLGYRRGPRLQSLDVHGRATERAALLEDPEAALDRVALRDWVWKGLARLPESLRAAVLLRHFGNYSTYEEISDELAIPVGTVRSRLAEARRKLSDELTSLSHEPDADERRSREAWNRFYADALDKVNRGVRDDFINHCRADMKVVAGRQVFHGRSKIELEIDGDIETGTLTHPVRIHSSGNITVIDTKVTNPPTMPTRCPVGFTLVIYRSGDRTHRAHLYPGRRVPLPDDWL